MSKKLILTAYGTKEDRDRLTELAQAFKTSKSDMLIQLLRAEHKRVIKIPRA